jgi:hypothetical protein
VVTDHVTQGYNDECRKPGSKLLDVVARAKFPDRYFESFCDRMMPRPFFISEDEIRGSAADLMQVFDILVSLPDRLFGGDMSAYCAQLDIGPREAALMQRISTGRPALFGRSDLYHDGTGLRLLEFNVGSQLGGIDQAQVLPALMEVDSFAEFAEEHKLGYVHTGQQIAAALRAAAAPISAEPVVALLEADGALSGLMHLLGSFQEMLAGYGLDVRLGEISSVRERGGKLYLDGTPVDVVLRYFSVNQICRDPAGEAAVEPILRAHEAGGTILLTTLDSFLYSSKGCLTLLSDSRWRDALSRTESALVDRFVPWTRNVVDGPTEVAGQTVDLLDYCRASRERLLLKPRNDFGGRGIVIGWLSTDAEWAEALDGCRTRGYIVQERVVPRREPVIWPGTREQQDWVACWSTFLTPDGYAGSHIRALPADETGIIGRHFNVKTRLTSVYHF